MEPILGSAPPMWAAMEPAPSPWAPMASPQGGRIPPITPGQSSSQIRMSAEALGYGATAALPIAGTVGVPGAIPFTGTELIAPTVALVAAVATRRGQPAGPVTDAEIEDFLNDALDLVPGTTEVEVRCEGGRAILTGNVPHKRHKRDVGEVAWAIPSINDVQNNVTIVARRRARASASNREGETHGGPVRKHA